VVLQNGADFVYIFHEMMHALAMGKLIQKGEKYFNKSGIQYTHVHVEGEKLIIDDTENEALNEGMTQALTEKILKVTSNGTYDTVKDIYRIISTIVGENTMIKAYFIDDENDLKYPFIKELEDKYGKEMGLDFCAILKNVSSISDEMLKLERENEHDKSDKIKSEIYNYLQYMLDRAIENTSDMKTKVQEFLIPLFSTSIGEKYSQKIIGEFFEDENIEETERKELALSIINGYIENGPYSPKKMSRDFIVKMYTKSGIVSQKNWNKEKALDCLINGSKLRDITNKINQIKYKKIGNYFMIMGDYKTEGDIHELINGKVFDINGNIVELNNQMLNRFQRRTCTKIY
jgi:hypothetical protein